MKRKNRGGRQRNRAPAFRPPHAHNRPAVAPAGVPRAMGAPRRPLSRGAETRRWVTGVLARRNEVRGMYSLAKAAVGSAFPPGGSEWQAARARTKMLGDSMAKINYDLQAGLEHRKSWPEALRRLRSRPVAGLRLLRKKIGLEKLFGGISPAARAKERPNAGRGSRAKAAP